MFCTNCGNILDDDTAFCPKCGNQMKQSASQQPYQQHEGSQSQQQPWPQPQEAWVQPQIESQPQHETNSQFQPMPQPQPQPRKNRRIPIVITACVVAVAAIAAVLVFVVLPRITNRGVWVVTKQTVTAEDLNGKSVANSTYTIDNDGRTVNGTYEGLDDKGNSTLNLSTSYDYGDNGYCASDNLVAVYPPNASDGSSGSGIRAEYDYQWSLGNDGMPKQLTRTSADGGVEVYTYQYDDKGQIVKKACTYKSGNVYTETIIDYDENGLVKKHVNKSKQGVFETNYKYVLNQSDKPTKCSYTKMETSSGKKSEEGDVTYEYDQNGNVKSKVTQKTEYKDDGSISGKITESAEYECTYIENPSPWMAKIAHLTDIPYPDVY